MNQASRGAAPGPDCSAPGPPAASVARSPEPGSRRTTRPSQRAPPAVRAGESGEDARTGRTAGSCSGAIADNALALPKSSRFAHVRPLTDGVKVVVLTEGQDGKPFHPPIAPVETAVHPRF